MNTEFEPNISTGQLCKGYYEHEIFRVHEEDFNPYSDFESIVWFEITQKIHPSAKVEIDVLTRELRALNI
jgi:hypothetical protein